MKNRFIRKKTPTVIQMEAAECGAASLSIILSYYGRFVPLEKLRLDCAVSRDGVRADNLIKAAKNYGLEGQGHKKSVDELPLLELPCIILWEYNHFVVIEGFAKNKVYINDPGAGPRSITYEELADGYSGLALSFEKRADFIRGGKPFSLKRELWNRLRSVRLPLLYLFLAGFCLLLPGLALPAFSRIFVDRFLVSRTENLNWLIGSVAVAGVIGGALTWLQNYILNRLNVKLSIQFSSQFFWHLLRLPVYFYTQRYPGEIGYRATLSNRVAKQMTGPLATTTINLFLVLFYGIAMLSYNYLIGTIGIVAALLNIVVFLLIQRSRLDAYARWQQETGKWIGNAIGGLNQIETIKATGLEGDTFSRYAGFYTKNIDAQQEISKKDAILGTAPVFFQALSVAALLTLGSVEVMRGALTFGELIALQILMFSFLTPIAQFVNFGQTMQNIKADIGRINDVLKNKEDPLYHKRALPSGQGGARLEGQLEFRRVTFGYNALGPPLIDDLSFVIKPGQRLALVGPSGCGKSTLAKLAAGLFRPWKGEIYYDGKPIKEVPPDIFYHSVGYVDQRIFLFSGTIRDNITLWNKAVSEPMIIKAAQASEIHDDIMQRERGYDNILAEAGRNLSGGQRQRLEIARALLYSPSLLIMDEATSALDTETEKSILENIRRNGCSAIMIAHRLSTIQDCDEIIVLDRGKVVQRGNHPELKRQTGLYRQLIESETGGYG